MSKAALLALWFLIPFLIGAGFEFVGPWFGWPALFILGLFWIGICVSIKELD